VYTLVRCEAPKARACGSGLYGALMAHLDGHDQSIWWFDLNHKMLLR
jgi:hypothetical protein